MNAVLDMPLVWVYPASLDTDLPMMSGVSVPVVVYQVVTTWRVLEVEDGVKAMFVRVPSEKAS